MQINAVQTQISIPTVLLIALVGFPQISETIYTPALPEVTASLHTTASLVEASLVTYFIGFAVGVASWGAVSDKWGRKRTMLLGLAIYLIAAFFCSAVHQIESLLAWRFVQALGASVGSVITQTIIRDIYEGKERARFFSILSGALAFSPALGPLLGGLITEFFGWRANFSILVILALFLIICTIFLLPETCPKFRQRTPLPLLKMLISARLWGHILLIGSTNGILFGFYQEAPFVFIQQLNMQPSQYGCLGLLIASATLFAAGLSYKNRYSQETMIRIGAGVALLGSFVFVSAALLDQFTLKLLLPTLFAIFLGIGLIIPNSLSLALAPYSSSVGTAGSLFGGLYYSLIALFTWIMSLIHNGTLLPLPLYTCALAVVLLIGCKLMKTSS